MALINNIEDLRKYVKLNATSDFSTLAPYINDAQDKYLAPYVGNKLLTTLETNPDDDLLKSLLCRALGPFSLALATDELSINFGESGHTVTRTDKLAPASDAKIERAMGSQFERAWANLDRALNYLVKNTSSYPDWKESDAYRMRQTQLFESAESFQEDGMVDIEYSYMTFLKLRTLIIRVEKAETITLLPPNISIDDLKASSEDSYKRILSALQAFTGSRVASIHTSQSTRTQRSSHGAQTEYKPVIRPLYEDMTDTGDYFDIQSDFWKTQIENLLVEGKHKEDSRYIEFNSADKRIFVVGARQENSSQL